MDYMDKDDLITWARERVAELWDTTDPDLICERVELVGALSRAKRTPAGSTGHRDAIKRLTRVHEGRFTYYRDNPGARASALRLGSR